MSNNKMKGLLKGLRYISQIFDNEKEQEMQIGFPTDVKHVAHIGWDGPSVNQPSWMNEFKGPPGSAPANLDGDTKEKDDGSVKCGSEDSSSRKGTRTQDWPLSPGSPATGPSELPKSSRRRSSTGATAEDKPRQRRSARSAAKELLDGVKPSRHSKDPNQGSESPSNLPDIPKKSRRKKSKDGSSRSRARAQSLEGDGGLESPSSVSKSRNKERCHSTSDSYPFEEDADKGYGRIS